MLIRIKLDNQNDRLIISVYAPTLDASEKNPEQAEQFYNKFKSVINKVRSRDNLTIARDFNANRICSFRNQP